MYEYDTRSLWIDILEQKAYQTQAKMVGLFLQIETKDSFNQAG